MNMMLGVGDLAFLIFSCNKQREIKGDLSLNPVIIVILLFAQSIGDSPVCL